jgi:hypothetical protein
MYASRWGDENGGLTKTRVPSLTAIKHIQTNGIQTECMSFHSNSRLDVQVDRYSHSRSDLDIMPFQYYHIDTSARDTFNNYRPWSS